MSNAQVARRADGNFDFDKWISDNGLSEMKQKLKEHGLTRPETISTQSNEFRKFMSDPVVLTTKGHLIPVLFGAIDKVSKPEMRYVNMILLVILPSHYIGLYSHCVQG